MKLKLIGIISILLFCKLDWALAQGEPKIVQFSGVVVSGGDSLNGVPYVSLYIPKTGRGALSNAVGYFSMPALTNDSIIIIATGYKSTTFVIPNNEASNISVMIELKQDTLLLPIIEVFPYYTEELFKQAFLALRLPEEDNRNMNRNLNDRLLAAMFEETYYDGAMNHRWFTQQQALRQERKYMDPSAYNPLTNPFAWVQLVKSIRNGDFKKKSYNEDGKKLKR